MVNLADIMDLCYELTAMAFPGCKRRCKLDSLQPCKRVAREEARVDCNQGSLQHAGIVQGMCRNDAHLANLGRDDIQMLTGGSQSMWPCVTSAFCCGGSRTSRRHTTSPHHTAVVRMKTRPPVNYNPAVQHIHDQNHQIPAGSLSHPDGTGRDRVFIQDTCYEQNMHVMPGGDPCHPFMVPLDVKGGQAVVHEARQHARRHGIEMQNVHRAIHPANPLHSLSDDTAPQCWYPGARESNNSPTDISVDGRQWFSFTGHEEDVNQLGGYAGEGRQIGINNRAEVSLWCAEGWAKSNSGSPYTAQSSRAAGGGLDPQRFTEQGESCEGACASVTRCWGGQTGGTEFDAVQPSGKGLTAKPAEVTDKLPSSRQEAENALDMSSSLADLQDRLSKLQESLTVVPRSPAFMPQRHRAGMDPLQDSTSVSSDDQGQRTARDHPRLCDSAVHSPSTYHANRPHRVTQDSCSSIELARAKAAMTSSSSGMDKSRDSSRVPGKAVLQPMDANQANGQWKRRGKETLLEACGRNPDGYCECAQCAVQSWHGSDRDAVISRVERELRELKQKEGDGALGLGLTSSPHGVSGRSVHSQELACKGQKKHASGKDVRGLATDQYSSRNTAHVSRDLPDDLTTTAGFAISKHGLRVRNESGAGGEHVIVQQESVCNRGQLLLSDRVQPAVVVKRVTAGSEAASSSPKRGAGGGGSGGFWGVSSLLGQSIRLSQSWSIGTKVHQSVQTSDRDRMSNRDIPGVDSSMDGSNQVRGSILSWFMSNNEPTSSDSSHLSSNHAVNTTQTGTLSHSNYYNDDLLRSSTQRSSTRATHSRQGSDASMEVANFQASRPRTNAPLQDVSHLYETDTAPLSARYREPLRERLPTPSNAPGTHTRYPSANAAAYRSDQVPHTGYYPEGGDAHPKKKTTFSAALPKLNVVQNPEAVPQGGLYRGQVRLGSATLASLGGPIQVSRRPPTRPLYHKAGGTGQLAVTQWRTADHATAATGGAGMLYRDWNDSDSNEDASSSSCHLGQSFGDLYSPILMSEPSIYQDLSCPAALEVANEIMMCMKLPGGMKYSPVSPDSPLFVLGIIHEFTAFDVALASTYLHRIFKRRGIMDRVLDIVVVPQLQTWDRSGRKLGIPPEYQSQQSLLSVLQFVSLILAAKVLGTRVDISTEALRVHIARSYSLPVALSQALDVEVMCLDALRWQLGPYLLEDQLEWLEALA